MIVIPYQPKPNEFSLFIGFDEEEFSRMRMYDPGILMRSQLPTPWQHLQISEIVVGYYTEKDQLKLTSLMNEGRIEAALMYITRGFVYRPDKGDYDGPGLSLIDRGEPRQ